MRSNSGIKVMQILFVSIIASVTLSKGSLLVIYG